MALNVLAVAESDSYLKWAVSLLGALPAGSRTDVVIPLSPVRPSAAQRESALYGSSFAGRAIDELSVGQLRRRVERDRPDAVLLAATGPTAHAVQDGLAGATHRPVLLAGIPGVALPARRKAWDYRGAVDLFVVHSRREREEYEMVRLVHGHTGRVGLATLPFLPPRQPPVAPDDPARRTVLFATQGKVPSRREHRAAILVALARLAANRPDLQVVVKTRGVPGEFHTHYEAYHYQGLWAELVAAGQVPDADAVRFAAGSMAEHLRTAAALVTVSSTAALEAVALGVPLHLVDDFGVSDAMINKVFLGSTCLAGLAALEKGEFRHPAGWWMHDNYFHPEVESTWVADLEDLVARARAGTLPPVEAGLMARRSPHRRRLDRLRLTRTGSAVVRLQRRARERAAEAAAAAHRA